MNSPKIFPFLVAGAAGGIVCLVVPALIGDGQAQTKLLPFQGRLTDASGAAVADGAKVVEFKMYDAPTGGTVKWAGEVHKLSVNGGLVNTMLGSKAGLGDVDFAEPTYLQITIDANNDGQITAADPPLLPRQSVVPAVFATESGNSRLLGGASWAAILADGSNDPVTGHIRGEKIAAASIGLGQLASSAVTTATIVDGTIQVEDLSEGVRHSVVPPGTVMAFLGADSDNPPPGWLYCRGQMALINQYPALSAAIGQKFGGDGITTFGIPDGRGLVLRGTGSQDLNGRAKEGPALGDKQEDQMQRITGMLETRVAQTGSLVLVGSVPGAFSIAGGTVASPAVTTTSASTGRHVVTFNSATSPGARASSNASGETRVSSLGVNYIIKF